MIDRKNISQILRLIEEIKDHENDLAKDDPVIAAGQIYAIDRKIRMVILDIAEKIYVRREYQIGDKSFAITAINEAVDFVEKAFIYLQAGEDKDYLSYLESCLFPAE